MHRGGGDVFGGAWGQWPEMVAFRTPERKPLSKGSEGLRTEFKKHPKGGLQKVPRGLRGRASELRHSSPGPHVPRCRGVVCVPPQVGPQPSGARRGCLGSLGEAPRCEMARGWPGQPELQPVTLRLHCGMARSQRFRGWKQEAAAAEGQGYPSAEARVWRVLAVQYIFLEGMNGSVVLLHPGDLTLGLVCVRWAGVGLGE